MMDAYTFLNKIGRGTHGTVYLVKKSDEHFVCKTVSAKNAKYALREISFLQQLSHRRVVRLLQHFHDASSHYLILEHANHNSLETVIGYHKKHGVTLNEDGFYNKIIQNVLCQITDALFYLHSKGVIHRDVKPTNILINQFFTREECLEFKLCDFSLSTMQKDAGSNLVGTPFYMAPEIIKKENYGVKVDMFSLGVVLYEMVALKRPFLGKNRKELQKNILSIGIECVPNCKDVFLEKTILGCLEKDAKARISSSEVRSSDRVKYGLAMCEIRYRDRCIMELESRIKELTNGFYPSPNESRKSCDQN